MRIRNAIVLLTVVCGALCGCGGTSARPAAYVAAGNEICAGQVTQLHHLHRPSTPEQALSYLPHVLAIMHTETGKLAALDPPASTQAQFASALTDSRELSAILTRFLQQMRAGIVQLTTFATVQTESIALSKRLNARFRSVGLTRCVA